MVERMHFVTHIFYLRALALTWHGIAGSGREGGRFMGVQGGVFPMNVVCCLCLAIGSDGRLRF